MLTRREILIGGIAAVAVTRTRTLLAAASQPATPVNFDVPAGACDCHTHIHGDPETFPLFSGRVYTPEVALPDEMAALHKALHLQRVVIVTPSVYGTDNSATLYGIKAHGANARGVAVIDEKTPESELDAMGRAGVRGIRLNLATGGTNDPGVGRQRFQGAVGRVKGRSCSTASSSSNQPALRVSGSCEVRRWWIASNASTIRPRVSFHGMPSIAASLGSEPGPTPNMNRPWAR